MEFMEDQTEFRLNKYFDQFKTAAFEDDNRPVGDTQEKIAMFERENAPEFVTEHSLIADLLTITKQQEISAQNSHSDGSDYNYSYMSQEHNNYLTRMKEATNKKIEEERKKPINLNFTAQAAEELKALKQKQKQEEEKKLKAIEEQQQPQRLQFKPEQKKTTRKDQIDPVKLAQNIALRLQNYDMYEHAKMYDANTVEGMLANDTELQTYNQFLTNIQHHSDPENDDKDDKKDEDSFDSGIHSQDSFELWKEEDDYLQNNQGDILGMEEGKFKHQSKT